MFRFLKLKNYLDNPHWIIIPGYIIALLMSRFVPKIFVGIAFDSGGVASGPMTSTFFLPLSIGACQAVGGDLIDTARTAGAGGGTIMHSRAIENEEASGFWGLSVQEEKEIVLIIAEHELKVPIMSAISEKFGMQSEAKGLVLSLPIDNIMGI